MQNPLPLRVLGSMKENTLIGGWANSDGGMRIPGARRRGMLGWIRVILSAEYGPAEYKTLERFWRSAMRFVWALFLVSGMAFGQAADSSQATTQQPMSSQPASQGTVPVEQAPVANPTPDATSQPAAVPVPTARAQPPYRCGSEKACRSKDKSDSEWAQTKRNIARKLVCGWRSAR